MSAPGGESRPIQLDTPHERRGSGTPAVSGASPEVSAVPRLEDHAIRWSCPSLPLLESLLCVSYHAEGGTPMPLVDHFHSPVYPLHSWESFHSYWASMLADSLGKQLLYPRFLVEVRVTRSARIEDDVLAW